LIIFALVNGFLILGSVGGQVVTFSNQGVVKTINVGVYWDVECLNVVNTVDWGTVEPGEDKIVDVFIRNEGNSDAVLRIQASNWFPSEFSQFATLSCSHQGQVIEVGRILKASFILSLNRTVQDITDFGFDILIEASG